MNKSYFFWQRKRIKKPSISQLKKDYYRLKSMKKLAKKYGVSDTTVWSWLKKSGITKDKWDGY